MVHNGSSYYTFWKLGIQCLALQTSTLLLADKETVPDIITINSSVPGTTESSIVATTTTTQTTTTTTSTTKSLQHYDDLEQIAWIRVQLDQCRMSKHPLFVFVDSDPNLLPIRLLKKLARGRTLCLSGVTTTTTTTKDVDGQDEEVVYYTANEIVDDVSIKSTDSVEDEQNENFIMQVRGTKNQNGLQWFTVNPMEPDDWSVTFESINE